MARALAGLESALTASIADQRDRTLGQELSLGDANRFSEEVGAARNPGLDAWCKFKVPSPVFWKNVAADIADARWVLTWKSAGGRRTVEARLVARGFQDPDLAAGLVDTTSCVSLSSSRRKVISFSSLGKRRASRNCDVRTSRTLPCKRIPFQDKFISMRQRSSARRILIAREN